MGEKSDALEHVYGAENPAATREAYQNWALKYDAENLANGYRAHSVGAAFAARYLKPDNGPILDAGCGTGLVGEALSLMGYRDLVGADLSPAMLEAAGELGVYSRLFEQDLGQPISEPDNSFQGVTCFGSLGPGHAPSTCFDEFARITRPGGHIIFNTRPDTHDELGHVARMQLLVENGVWREVDRSEIFKAFLLAEPNVVAQVFVFEVL